MRLRILAVLVLPVVFLSCRDGPGTFVEPAQGNVTPSPDAVQIVTAILEDPLVDELVRRVDDRGAVSRLRRSVRDASRAPTGDHTSTLRRAFVAAQTEITTVVDEGDGDDAADREILGAALALVLADAENILEAAGVRDVTGTWGQR